MTDEDYLEYVHRLQHDEHRPRLLFDALRDNYLLFLGCRFPDWLTRFFVRTLVGKRLQGRQGASEAIADELIRECDDGSVPPLATFLSQCFTDIYNDGNEVAFVDELYERWRAANPSTEDDLARDSLISNTMAAGAVFLSYPHEEREAAEKLARALEAQNLSVWFDKDDLGLQDAWESKIQFNIEHNCALFVPLISRNVDRDGFFRREWKWAINHAETMRKSYICPVIIDNIDFENSSPELIPAAFKAVQVTRLPEANPSETFISAAKEAVMSYRREYRQREF